MTPLVAELHNAHKERLARFARAALPEHKPISGAPQPIVDPVKLPETPPPASKSWFYIEDEIGVPFLPARTIPISQIQRATCRYFKITAAELFARRRTKSVVVPRQIAMFLCKTYTRCSLPEIGRRFGGFDHSTILSNIRVTERRMRADWRVAYDIAHIEGRLA